MSLSENKAEEVSTEQLRPGQLGSLTGQLLLHTTKAEADQLATQAAAAKQAGLVESLQQVLWDSQDIHSEGRR